MPEGDSQEMGIGHLAMTGKFLRLYKIRGHQRDIVREEYVVRVSQHTAKDRDCLPRRFSVADRFLVRGNANKTTLRYGACSPTGPLVPVEPLRSQLMMNMNRPRKGHKDVDIQERDH